MTHQTSLKQIFSRIEGLAGRLWDDNSTRAVDAQALAEEFRAEVERFEAALAHADELTAAAKRAHEQEVAFLKTSFESESHGLKDRIAVLEKTLLGKEEELAKLLETLAEHDKRAADVHAQTLKASAASEEASVKKMEELYKELTDREAALESSWKKRHDSLQADVERLRQLQSAREAELQAKELRLVEEEGRLKKQATDLELKTQQLQSEYRLKQQELESIKAGLQRSITELVRQYQSRLKSETVAAPER